MLFLHTDFFEVVDLWLARLFDVLSLWREDFSFDVFFLVVSLLSVERFLSLDRKSLARLSLGANFFCLNFCEGLLCTSGSPANKLPATNATRLKAKKIPNNSILGMTLFSMI